jgi:hypothetical protein
LGDNMVTPLLWQRSSGFDFPGQIHSPPPHCWVLFCFGHPSRTLNTQATPGYVSGEILGYVRAHPFVGELKALLSHAVPRNKLHTVQCAPQCSTEDRQEVRDRVVFAGAMLVLHASEQAKGDVRPFARVVKTPAAPGT